PLSRLGTFPGCTGRNWCPAHEPGLAIGASYLRPDIAADTCRDTRLYGNADCVLYLQRPGECGAQRLDGNDTADRLGVVPAAVGNRARPCGRAGGGWSGGPGACGSGCGTRRITGAGHAWRVGKAAGWLQSP